MKKENEHPVYISLRDWSKARKVNTVAKKDRTNPVSVCSVCKTDGN